MLPIVVFALEDGLDDELVAVVDVMLDDVVGLAELEGRLVVGLM